MGKFNVALLQTKVYDNKEKNINNAVKLIEKVSREGANFAVLPEMFCCPYDNSYFREYGEDVTVFNTEFCKIGLGVCYDIRFPDIKNLVI